MSVCIYNLYCKDRGREGDDNYTSPASQGQVSWVGTVFTLFELICFRPHLEPFLTPTQQVEGAGIGNRLIETHPPQ